MADEDLPGTETPAPETRRDDIASAFDTVETREAPPGEAPPAGSPGEPPPAAAAPAAPLGERHRDPATGKFVPGPAPSATPGKPAATSAAKQPLTPATPPQAAPKAPLPDQAAAVVSQTRAPASWKPGAREHWAKLPADVQQEVIRRETEVARTMQESHKAREALTHVQGLIAPYAQNIAASGHDALTVIGTLLKADNTLRHGTTNERALLVADIVKSFGVDIVALDAALAGQPHQADPNQQLAERMRQEMQAQLKPVLGYFNQVQGARRNAFQQISQQAASEVDTFGQDAAHEFFEDVREDMADIIDLAQSRGHSISLQDAYERAIKLNPQVADIVSKRAEAERVNNAAAAAQRARRTAASISGSAAPAGAGPGPAGDSRRAEIEAAWDASSGS